jgi:hypothetical protein
VRSNGRWRAGAASCAALLGLALGCSSNGAQYHPYPYDAGVTEPGPVEANDAGGDGSAPGADGGRCAVVVAQHPDEGHDHIACTSPADYLTVPPSSGNHYPVWPAYGIYDQPIRWGHLVHNMEHGAVVIVYNCPDGCDDDLARAKAFVNGNHPDPAQCSPARLSLVPDPTLDVKWAAAAWTWTLRADCFEEAAFGQFVTDHLGTNPYIETICGGYTLDQLCTTP